MDKLAIPEKASGGPVIALANWFQFAPGERAVRPCVESRMFLWCVSGRGSICVNSLRQPFLPGQWVFLPWRHKIIYEADSRHPFRVGGVHLIPWHSHRVSVVFKVAHHRRDSLAGHSARRDASGLGGEKMAAGEFGGEMDPLALLAASIVERFQRSNPARAQMASLAEALIAELRIAGETNRLSSRPAVLNRMQDYARSHLDRLLGVEDLALVAQCSPASVHRLFQKFEGMSPGRWMAAVRADQAAFLLRTTNFSIREVGAKVGLTDPFHFSRFFKRMKGQPPHRYRKSRGF